MITAKLILIILGLGMAFVGSVFVMMPANLGVDRTHGLTLLGGAGVALLIAAGIHGFEGG